MSTFVALVWGSTFAACSATRGLVGSTAGEIERATAQLGEWRILGTGIVYFGYAVLTAAAVGVYTALWVSWVRSLPAAGEGDAAARDACLRLAIAAEVRVMIHLALVTFAVGNFSPLGWASLTTQVAAVASVVMAAFVLGRAGKLGGPPHGHLWTIAALLLGMSAATIWYVVRQVGGGASNAVIH